MCIKLICITAIKFVLLYLHSYPVAPYNAMISNVTMNTVVTYKCYADGGPGNSYQWIRIRQMGKEVVSMTQELTLDNTNPLNADNYICSITNDAGSDTAMMLLNGEM